jgi:hypothetical protein
VLDLKTFYMSRKKFTTIEAAQRLMQSMEIAINNMIDEIKKPVDPEINGSARKAELQSIKQTATDATTLYALWVYQLGRSSVG